MPTIIGVACLLWIWSAGPSAAQEEPAEARAIAAAMDAMVRATIDKDVPALQRIYHDELMYSHTSGLTQTKGEVLKALAASRSQVQSMTFDKTALRVYGSVALFKTNTTLVTRLPDGNVRKSALHILWVLVRGSEGWQVSVRHPSRLPEAAP